MSKSNPEEADTRPAAAPVMLNKDLIKQFDKVLSVSCQKADQKRSSSLTGVCPSSGSVQRKRRSRKKKVFVLRPSRLKVESAKDSPAHFSFENCSKELESIMAPSSSGASQPALRPRSASLPSQQSKSDVPKKRQTMVKKALVTTASKPSSKDRVVKKRKHLSPEAKTAGPERKTSTCAQQAARQDTELSQDIDRLADYLEESVLLPKKMSYMAEMMYT